MGFFDEIITVAIFAVVFSLIGVVNFSFWSFLFAFLFAYPISTLICRKFAAGQKTLGSNGRYVKTSRVYLFFMAGIVVSSYFGSLIASYVVEQLNADNFMGILILSLFTSFFAYVLVKLGYY